MNFWLVAIFLTVLLLGLIWVSGRSAQAKSQTREAASDALQAAQLAELERNLAVGQIGELEADSMRQEVNRAHSRAMRRGEDGVFSSGSNIALWSIMGVCVVSAFLTYNRLGAPSMPDLGLVARAELENPSQEKMREMLSEEEALPPVPQLNAETQDILEKLKLAIDTHPDVAEGYYHLRVLHYGTGNFHEAAIAQQKYIELSGPKVTADDYAILAETLALSVNGYVSPEAETAIRQSLQIDQNNTIATFYMGMALKQDDRWSDAKTIFTQLKAKGIANPDWLAEIDRQIASIDETLDATKGPSAEDMANAANMSDEDRANMIGGMVDGLKSRLAAEGGKPAEWAQLINALRQLGRDDEASDILKEAQSKFPDDAQIQGLK